MIGKVVGYAGFQSYGDLPFSTLKPGKEQQKDDKIWQATGRQQDKKPHLQNYHHLKSTYRKEYLENTMPEHYNVNLVKKGSTGFDGFSPNNSIKTHQKLESSVININQLRNSGLKNQLLNTGVEHWKSTYRKANDVKIAIIKELNFDRKGLSRSLANGFGTSGVKIANKQVNAVNSTNNNNNKSNIGLEDGNLSLAGNSERFNPNQRSASAVKCESNHLLRPDMPEWSKHVKAYTNKALTGVTQYKFIYGERIGHQPKPHILDQFSTKQPKLYNPLKAGTTQHVEHIPGYQGFLPAAKTFGKAFEHGKGENTRTTFLKSNLIDNYHVQIPGYSGFKTKQNFVSDDKLRSSCFRSNEFVGN